VFKVKGKEALQSSINYLYQESRRRKVTKLKVSLKKG
jgi:hypothetical protein